MKLSKDKLTNYINLYVNDVSDYGDDEENEIVESIFTPFMTTLEEGEHDVYSLLKETSQQSPAHKQSVMEFIEYVKNI